VRHYEWIEELANGTVELMAYPAPYVVEKVLIQAFVCRAQVCGAEREQ
jgi:hypothetical protein